MKTYTALVAHKHGTRVSYHFIDGKAHIGALKPSLVRRTITIRVKR